MTSAPPTAAVLLIGDEILSGRTKDKNLGFIADYLTALGIDLREARLVPDVEEEIVAALNALRHRYSYVFTTGGIGPTHDDITADAVAKAFGVEIDHDPRAVEILLAYFKEMGREPNEARMRMARIPQGAALVTNKISGAPGFWIGNVIVMAGVPSVMHAMMDTVGPQLKTGRRVLVETIAAGAIPEGAYAAGLEKIVHTHAEVSIGSYPAFTSTGVRNQIVLRSREADALAQAASEVRKLIEELSSLAGRR